MSGFETLPAHEIQAKKALTKAAFQERLRNSAEALGYILIQRKVEPLLPDDMTRIQDMLRALGASATGFGYDAVAKACTDTGYILDDLIQRARNHLTLTGPWYDRLEKSLVALQSLLLETVGDKDEDNESARPVASVQDILIVDDDKELAEVVAVALQQKGYRVAIAANGEEGLKQMETHKFDLVVLDIDMPGMNGRQMLRVLKQNPAFVRTPVLMLTGYSDHEYVISALYAGATDYVSKPVNTDVVSAKVDKILNAIPAVSGGKAAAWNNLKLEE